MKLQNRMVAALLLTILLLSALPVRVCAVEYRGEAYEQLTSDDQRKAYVMVEEGIASLTETITFPKDFVIYRRDLTDIIHAVCVDHPEYFWFLETGVYYYHTEFGGERVESFTPDYYLDSQIVNHGSQELADAMIAFQKKVNEIVNGIPVSCTSDYDIALYLHDYLISKVTYNLSGDHESAFAALIRGKAACYGYAKAYQCLLNAAGIRARTITGTSPDENGNVMGHAWNQVWIDGVCCYTDVTWDDMITDTVHAYFNLSLEEISLDHTPDQEFILPECSHTGLDYISRSPRLGVGSFSDETDGKTAASCFALIRRAPRRVYLACEFAFSGKNFLSWLNEVSQDIAGELGLSGEIDVAYYQFDKTYYVVFSGGTLEENKIPITEIALNVQEVSLFGIGAQEQLAVTLSPADAHIWDVSYESSDESIAEVDGHGLVTAIGVGTAVITARGADGKASASCTVTVTEAPPHNHGDSIRQIASFEADCVSNGSTGYYICTKCCLRFADEACTQPITEVSQFVLPATGHTAARWQRIGQEHCQVCSCGTQIEDSRAPHRDQDSDGRCDDCGAVLENAAKPVDTAKGGKGTGRVLPVVLVVVLAASVTIFVVGKRRFWF